MNLTDYITLPHLYKLLSTKAISIAVLGVCFLFIFSMNLVGIVVFMISALAIPFSLYMLCVLYTYKKISWIIGFLTWMGISFIPVIFMTNDNLLMVVLQFLPLLFFALYAILLKEKVGEWLLEMDFERETRSHIHQNRIS